MCRFLKLLPLSLLALSLGAQVPAKPPIKEIQLPKRPILKREALKAIPFQVEYPSNSQHFEMVDNKKKVKLKVRFNLEVKQNTLVAGQSFVVNFPKMANASGKITWANGLECTWVSDKEIQDICKFSPDCSFTLIIKEGVEAKTGAKLDGDKDGKAGGEFKQLYTLIG